MIKSNKNYLQVCLTRVFGFNEIICETGLKPSPGKAERVAICGWYFSEW